MPWGRVVRSAHVQADLLDEQHVLAMLFEATLELAAPTLTVGAQSRAHLVLRTWFLPSHGSWADQGSPHRPAAEGVAGSAGVGVSGGA